MYVSKNVIIFFHEQREIMMFYPMLAEGDSILWLGSREKDLFVSINERKNIKSSLFERKAAQVGRRYIKFVPH